MPPGVGYPAPMGGGMSGRPMAPGAMGSTAPAMGRPDNQGMQTRAAVLADLGMKLLTQAITLAGPNTEQGQALLKGVALIAKAYPAPVSPDLSQQEVKLLASRANPAPMGNPGQDASAFLGRIGGMAPQTAGAA